ncbi:Ribosomal protein L25/L23 [Thermocrinis albus DSM 14484]|uniref:Large ribosomal subunit protein uL23 n=1 Tax=Thermocrinis albus (strain DSM 14484 / JCM 11386 / HI 11/12) TaxID=638303 RepID=D3SQ13_THEAH|nr:50S ribosomal protein L23 [Thermocrinis albus]ADC89250.1 Ribosomal protein L25/L23 [Thermocrinis albus DSM 14484]
MRRPEEIIIRPIITEKSNRLMEDYKKYTFEVALDATKHEIKYAIEKLFGVKVLKVNTMIVKPRKKRVYGKFRKYGYTRAYKKAIVTIDPSQEIDLLSV